MKSRRTAILLTLLVACLIRLALFFALRSTFDFVRTGRILGSEAYDVYAVNLLATGVYGRTPGVPDAMIPPGYSFVLAALYGLFGRGALQVILLHTALDCLSILLLIDIARRLFPHGRTVGLVAGLAFALYPYLIFQSLTVIDTPLFTTLLNSSVWLLVVLRQRERIDSGTLALAGLAGLVMGFAALTRPVVIPFAVLTPLWFLLRRSWKDTVVRMAPVAVVGAAVVGAWTIRNDRVFGRFLPMTTTAGSNFWQGNSPLTVPLLRAGYDVQWTAPDTLEAADPHSPEADAERFRRALDFLALHRQQIGELLWVKFLTHWSIDVAPRFNPTDAAGPVVEIPGRAQGFQVPELPPTDPITLYSQPLFDRLGRAVHRVYWGGMLVLAILSLPLLFRSWRDVSLIWLLELAMTAVYVAFRPATRYRAPSDPLLFLLSAYTLVWLAQRLGLTGRRASESELPEQRILDQSPSRGPGTTRA